MTILIWSQDACKIINLWWLLEKQLLGQNIYITNFLTVISKDYTSKISDKNTSVMTQSRFANFLAWNKMIQ